MTIYDEIRKELTEKWQSGATQQEIADSAGVTNPYINNLLSGKRKVESMKLETLFKLFPNAEINLTGAQIAGDNALQIQGNVITGLEEARNRILEAETLSDAEKIKMLKVLK